MKDLPGEFKNSPEWFIVEGVKNPDPAHQQEERILAQFLKIISIIAVVPFIPSMFLSIQERLWVIALLDLLAYAYVLFLTFRKDLPFLLKAVSMTLLMYILGAALLVFTGPFGAGIIYLFAFILLTALFFPVKWTISANILAAMTLITFGVLNYTGILQWEQGIGSVIVIIVNFLLVSTLLSYGTSYAMNGMRYRCRKEIILRKELKESLHEKDLLLKELNHRVRNSVQQISSLIRLRARRLGSPKEKEALLDIENRIGAISQIYNLLHHDGFAENAPMDEYIKRLVENTRNTVADYHYDIRIHLDMEKVLLPIEQLTPCGLVVNEVLTNTFKHAFPSGFERTRKITIFLREKEGEIHIRIGDNGTGFDTKKKRDSDSLGQKLLTTLVEVQLGGSYSILSGGGGTEVNVRFKKAV